MSDTDIFAHVFTFAGWSFLPSFATTALQRLYYSLTVRAGSPPPQPGQSVYAQHRRRIHILVLTLYLLYTLLQTLHDIRLAGDFYTSLGVTPDSDEREIRSKFRRLAARFHPDKLPASYDSVGSYDGLEGRAASKESAFVHIKLAHDTLLDPAKKFAYDHFGPGIVRVQQPGLKTIRDYVYAGLRSLALHYVQGAVVLLALNWLWLPRWGMFWRYMVMLALATLELYFLTHEWKWESQGGNTPQSDRTSVGMQISNLVLSRLPLSPLLRTYRITSLLPFQILTLARRLSISLNIFISQLAPPRKANSPISSYSETRQREQSSQQLQQQVMHLSNLAQRTDAEATNLLDMELTPFKMSRGYGARDGSSDDKFQTGIDESATIVSDPHADHHHHHHQLASEADESEDKTTHKHGEKIDGYDRGVQLIHDLRQGMVEEIVANAIRLHHRPEGAKR